MQSSKRRIESDELVTGELGCEDSKCLVCGYVAGV